MYVASRFSNILFFFFYRGNKILTMSLLPNKSNWSHFLSPQIFLKIYEYIHVLSNRFKTEKISRTCVANILFFGTHLRVIDFNAE